jgi:hypothetical protein
LAFGRADSGHYPPRFDLALRRNPVQERVVVTSAAGVVGDEFDGTTASAVAWPAIFSGAFAAFAVTLVLVALGSGIGLTTVSPWEGSGASAKAFTIGAGIWIIVVQWLASGVGGYLAGRLRTKWQNLHTDEVFFRDTAHGFLAWAVATVVGVALVAMATSSLVSGGTRAAATVAQGVAQRADNGIPSSDYLTDKLLRPMPGTVGAPANQSPQNVNAEVGRILATGLKTGDVSAEDHTYLVQLVSAKTGLNEADATRRTDDIIAQAKSAELQARQAADAARKATATFSIFSALALVIGAFIASAAGALGGRLRDEY